MKKIAVFFGIVFWLCIGQNVFGAVKTQVVEYKHDDVLLEGYLAYDQDSPQKKPLIILVHDWTGVGEFVKARAQRLAALGYVAFAVDMYGKGIRPRNPQEASAQAAIYRQDRDLMRSRVQAGLKAAQKFSSVNTQKIAAIGYCFGGGVVLELARSGAPVQGVVSFHGNLDTPRHEDARQIKAQVLVLHGADDPYVPAEQISAFTSEMRGAGVDWQMIFYGNSVHSFTNPAAGSDPAKGAAYNQAADQRSWQAMLNFFAEIF